MVDSLPAADLEVPVRLSLLDGLVSSESFDTLSRGDVVSFSIAGPKIVVAARLAE